MSNALADLATSYARSIDVQGEMLDGIDAGARAHALYRIVEQALLNCAADERAARATVWLTHQNGELAVMVEDDGVGVAGIAP